MHAQKQLQISYLLRSFAILLLIGFLLPSRSALAQTPTPNPLGKNLPPNGVRSQVLVSAAESASLTSANRLQDPSFEAYTPNPYWSEYSTNFGTPLCKIADCFYNGVPNGTAAPRTGSVWAWFGGTTKTEESELYQQIMFPSCGSTKLQFYFWIGAAGSGSDANDYFAVYIDNTQVFLRNATQKNLYPNYTLVTIDVSSFSNGAQHVVDFYSFTTGQIVTFNLDDVSLVGSNCIFGNTGIAGVTLSYTDGTPKTVLSQPGGSYALPVSYNWSGTVTPSKSDYIFSPVNRTYANVQTDLWSQDYTPIPLYAISGNTGVGAATLSYTDGTPKTVISQSNGNYSFKVPAGWSGIVTVSHPCFTFTPPTLNYINVQSSMWSQSYTPGTINPDCADIDVTIGDTYWARFGLQDSSAVRGTFTSLDSGPAKIVSTNDLPILSSERFLYTFQNSKSYAEMMGYPGDQLTTDYWFTWYNNISYSTQLRVSNMGLDSAEVKVYAGTTLVDTLTLFAGQGARKSYADLDSGPLHVVSTDGVTPILASERFIQTYKNSASYSEMMGYPGDQLATEYWFPWYNNLSYSTQLRVSNLGGGDAEIKVYAGSGTDPIDTFILGAGQGARKSYAVDNGPLHVVSTDGVTPILASERFIQTFGNSASYAEMMGYAGDQLTTEYCFPWYNNTNDGGVTLSSQLRVSNMGAVDAPIKVYLAGSQIDSFTIIAGQGARKSYAGSNNGPLCVVSTDGVTPILASERFISTYLSSAAYSEMMGYPTNKLASSYLFPWYNNVSYSTELRIAKP